MRKGNVHDPYRNAVSAKIMHTEGKHSKGPSKINCCWNEVHVLYSGFNVACLLVSWHCHNKEAQTGWHKQQTFVVSQFWTLEIQDQGVSRVGNFWGLWGPYLSPVSPLPCGSLRHSHSWACRWCFLCVFPTSSLMCLTLCPNFPFS